MEISKQKRLEYILDCWSKDGTQSVISSLLVDLNDIEAGIEVHSQFFGDTREEKIQNFCQWFAKKYGLTELEAENVVPSLIENGIYTPYTYSLEGNVVLKTPYREVSESLEDSHPIQILISPDASFSEIQDFLEKNKAEIVEAQELKRKHRPQKRIKSKTNRHINEFVYTTQKLSDSEYYEALVKRFGKEVATKYGSYDMRNAILGIEKKRRS